MLGFEDMSKSLLIVIFSALLFPALAQRTDDTFHLYFDLNISTLNKYTEKKIDLLIYNDKIINGSSIMVIGYADYLGSEGYNKNLSMDRARHIKEYLVKYGIDANNIKLCVGKGEITREDMTDKDGNPVDRRVDIVVNNRSSSNGKIGTGHPNQHRGGNNETTTSIDTKTTRIPEPDSYEGKSTARKNNTQLAQIPTLKPGQTIQLENVHFPRSSHVMLPESYEALEKLLKVLRENPTIRISIEGHVCCLLASEEQDATDIDTQEPILSVNRARAIFNYLVSNGIDAKRLQYVGYGMKHPIVPFETSEEDAAKNRRVEIRVLHN